MHALLVDMKVPLYVFLIIFRVYPKCQYILPMNPSIIQCLIGALIEYVDVLTI